MDYELAPSNVKGGLLVNDWTWYKKRMKHLFALVDIQLKVHMPIVLNSAH